MITHNAPMLNAANVFFPLAFLSKFEDRLFGFSDVFPVV